MSEISNEVKTLSELVQEAIGLGFPKEVAESFKVKSQVIAVIESLKTKPKETESEVKKVDSIEEKPNPREEKKIEKMWRNKAQQMMDIWQSEPMVSLMVPSEPGRQPGIVEWRTDKHGDKFQIALTPEDTIWSKTFNGAKWLVPKGVYVQVPKRVADAIQKEMEGLNNAGREWLTDRIDKRTGKMVNEVIQVVDWFYLIYN